MKNNLAKDTYLKHNNDLFLIKNYEYESFNENKTQTP